MTSSQIKRLLGKEFNYTRFFEPMIPGKYKVQATNKEEIFAVNPGDTYQTLYDHCESFCEEHGNDVMIQHISFEDPCTSEDILRYGLVIEKSEEDPFEQGNIFLTPAQLKSVIDVVGKLKYSRTVKMQEDNENG